MYDSKFFGFEVWLNVGIGVKRKEDDDEAEEAKASAFMSPIVTIPINIYQASDMKAARCERKSN